MSLYLVVESVQCIFSVFQKKKSDITKNLEPDAELDQIKSTYRLQRNEEGEPAHIPFRYDVNLRLGGLYESDRNDQGYFEFDADATILFTHNTDSKYLVLNAGNNPGYEVLSVDLSCKDEVQTQFEHYKEKELLIIKLLVSEEEFQS